ncbi:KR domain-containing protein [Tumebacillus permanentifrigoris]|uniref:KR domain-containing protein n=1 Tax=Tumebacillus permanentifrigoris TaxID=378543 RepID=A0A316D9S0_9BACL|nr:KR domain-containing protein [Tumebacillus permanentifrigoris]PWK13935.1 KR domain-containing protein [Tumebacillus permanentifrigoris]
MSSTATARLRNLIPPAITYPADGSVLPCNRYRWRPIELPSVEIQAGKLAGKKVLVVGGAEATYERLAAHLRSYGVTCYRFDGAALQPGVEVDGILDLNIEEPFSLATGTAWEAPFASTIRAVQAVYEAWAEETNANRLFYVAVTAMGGQMGYDGEKAAQPLGGVWAGFAKSLPREIPNCHVKVIDVARAEWENLEQILVQELFNWGVFEVGYQNGVRYGLFAEHVPLGEPVRSIEEGDTILISGGARGIGFALAQDLARNFGCSVVITGRSEFPSGAEEWLALGAEAFKKFQFESLRTSPSVLQTRKQLERIKSQRELYHNVQQMQDEGLRVRYEACDFTDEGQVHALVQKIGPSLRGVIHNAGIEETIRLNAKSVEACLATVRVKINGFLHLATACADLNLNFFCNVGSLSGRWGGMIGQLDYAGGNEALTRLGFWATANGLFDVQTICWPTWDKLGLITNYQAALKYASAIHVQEGIYHWQRNLLAGDAGECIYMGKVGKALVPMQINGFLPVSIVEAPDIERIHSQVFYMGEVQDFRLFKSVASVSRMDRRLTTCIEDVRWNGKAMMPVSLLLEYVLSLAEWVVPEGWQELPLRSIDGLEVNLPALAYAADEPAWELGKKAVGHWDGDAWVVTVTLSRGSQLVARCQLVHRAEAVPVPVPVPVQRDLPFTSNAPDLPDTPESPLVWRGGVFAIARWHASVGHVPACSSGQIWSVPHVPTMRLPSAHLENIFRAASTRQADRLTVRRLGFLQENLRCTTIAQVGDTWYVQDEAGNPGFWLEGVACS